MSTPTLAQLTALLDDSPGTALAHALNHRGARDAIMVHTARTGRFEHLMDAARGARMSAEAHGVTPCGPMVVASAAGWVARGHLEHVQLQDLARVPSYDPARSLADLIQQAALQQYPAHVWAQQLVQVDIYSCLDFAAEVPIGQPKQEYGLRDLHEMLAHPDAPGAAAALDTSTTHAELRRGLLLTAAGNNLWPQLATAGRIAEANAIRRDSNADTVGARLVQALASLASGPGWAPQMHQGAVETIRSAAQRIPDTDLAALAAGPLDLVSVRRYCTGPSSSATNDPLLDGLAALDIPDPWLGTDGPAR